jgi:hypothetical protein
MRYVGDYNTRCPLCQTPVVANVHPLVIRLNGEIKKGKRVCSKCFQKWTSEHSKLQTEKSIIQFEQWLSDQLIATEFAGPAGYAIKGFWFGKFDDGSLGLIINYSSQD